MRVAERSLYAVLYVDAFAEHVFQGNQAAVYFPENGWPSDAYMTNLCRENNYSDIALLVKKEGGYDIRWFTQQGEIEFCGHASMAASYVVLFCEEPGAEEVHFDSLSRPINLSISEINCSIPSIHGYISIKNGRHYACHFRIMTILYLCTINLK